MSAGRAVVFTSVYLDERSFRCRVYTADFLHVKHDRGSFSRFYAERRDNFANFQAGIGSSPVPRFVEHGLAPQETIGIYTSAGRIGTSTRGFLQRWFVKTSLNSKD